MEESVRRYRLSVTLGVLLAALIGLLAPGTASAAPCSGPPALALQVAPSPWLYGRPITPSLVETSSGFQTPGTMATFRFQALDPAHPISQPSIVSASADPTVEHAPINGVPLVLRKGDGTALVTATWSQFDSSSPSFSCEGSASMVITGTDRGQRPRFKIQRGRRGRIVFIDNSCRHENLALLGRVTITVSGDGKTRRSHLNDQCDSDWRPRRADAGHWELRHIGNYLHFIPHRGLGFGDHRFEATIRFGKRVLASYFFFVRVGLR